MVLYTYIEVGILVYIPVICIYSIVVKLKCSTQKTSNKIVVKLQASIAIRCYNFHVKNFFFTTSQSDHLKFFNAADPLILPIFFRSRRSIIFHHKNSAPSGIEKMRFFMCVDLF